MVTQRHRGQSMAGRRITCGRGLRRDGEQKSTDDADVRHKVAALSLSL